MDLEELRAYRNLNTIVEAMNGGHVVIAANAGQFTINANGFTSVGPDLNQALENFIVELVTMGNPTKLEEAH